MKITDNKNKFTLTKLAQLIALSGLALSMVGCGLDEASDANSNNGETVYDFAPPEPKAGNEQYSMLKQDRERWMNEHFDRST